MALAEAGIERRDQAHDMLGSGAKGDMDLAKLQREADRWEEMAAKQQKSMDDHAHLDAHILDNQEAANMGGAVDQ